MEDDMEDDTSYTSYLQILTPFLSFIYILVQDTTPCGLLGLSFFCPFKCGFFKRLFRIGNCSNDKTPASTLTNYINQITLSDRTISMNGVTPEDQALKYLIETDQTFSATEILTLSSKTSNVVQFRISQRYALLTLFFQQTVGAQWDDTTGWLVNANECTWYGISCTSIDLGGTVGMQNVVTTVEFYDNLKGTIPADLGLLTALTSFYVGINALTGTLPASIGQWTALTYFEAYDNELTGTLPASIGQWTALKVFNVFSNALTGTLPVSIGQWTALTEFNVNTNSLTGTLPAAIGQWTVLTYFGVFNNALIGTIPASIGNWSLIRSAIFDSNQLTGTMPNGICPYIDATIGDVLEADCVICSLDPCCTRCFN
jgi:hypothetical protein